MSNNTLHIAGDPELYLEPMSQCSPEALLEYAEQSPSLRQEVFWMASLTDTQKAQGVLEFFTTQEQTDELLSFTIRKSLEESFVGVASMYKRFGRTLMEYSIAEAERNQGFATRAVGRLIEVGREKWGDGPVDFDIFPENEPSKAVARKLGATFSRNIRLEVGYGNFKIAENWELP